MNKLARGVLAVPGISRVQAATRPEGTPLQHTTIPFMLSASSASQLQLLPFQQERMDDLLVQADDLAETIEIMQRMYATMQQVVSTTDDMVGHTHELEDITNELRDNIADFDDFWRPLRNYFHWEPHCYNIPICWSLSSFFQALDGVDQISAKMHDLVVNLDQLNTLMPQMAAQFPAMIATMQSTRTM
ncbi:MMPL family RND transporter, partial [Mycolicibacterium sphagni]|nr:MMPL family RND transporter [Mycolicibacterium sphagni]